VVSGSPAIPHREWLRASAAMVQLGDLLKEVRALRRRVEMLEKEKGG
jgi:UDP-3-O-[3-hydroxymyristoyl] glucosamine N-acyltransferase